MAAVGEVHPENRISVLTGCQKDGHIGLASGVGLDVGVLGPEEFTGTCDGGPFDDVCEFASPIVAAARVALGILVGEDGTGGFENGLGDEVLRGDQLEPFVLAVRLLTNGFVDEGIDFLKGARAWIGHSQFLAFGSPLVSVKEAGRRRGDRMMKNRSTEWA
jgi:hypothetical protein